MYTGQHKTEVEDGEEVHDINKDDDLRSRRRRLEIGEGE